jgi:nicotinamidase-related amidase
LAPTLAPGAPQNRRMSSTAATHGMARPRLPRSARVLLLVDFINPLNFPGGEQLAPAALEAARATAALKVRLAAQGVATIYANDNYGVWQSDFHSLVSTCLGLDGAPGEIARLLYPQAPDITILKPRHSAFYASPLELLLTEMEASELVICGLATDMCVQLTAGDAFLREFACWVPADCNAAESAQLKKASLAFMASVLKCDVRPSTTGVPHRRPRANAHP